MFQLKIMRNAKKCESIPDMQEKSNQEKLSQKSPSIGLITKTLNLII